VPLAVAHVTFEGRRSGAEHGARAVHEHGTHALRAEVDPQPERRVDVLRTGHRCSFHCLRSNSAVRGDTVKRPTSHVNTLMSQ
jgi:hypothetical protein